MTAGEGGDDVLEPSAPVAHAGEPRYSAMFPLSAVLLPHGLLPLHLFEPRYRQLATDCLAGDGTLGVVLIARGSEVGGGDVRTNVGTLARIVKASAFEDGRWALLLRGEHRIEVNRWLDDDPYPKAMVTPLPDADTPIEEPVTAHATTADATTAVRRVRSLLSEAGQAPPMGALAPDLGEDEMAWALCNAAPVGPLDRQHLLEAPSVQSRLTRLATLCLEMADDVERMLAGG